MRRRVLGCFHSRTLQFGLFGSSPTVSMKHVIHLMCAVSTSHTLLFLRLLTLHTMSNGTREMMSFWFSCLLWCSSLCQWKHPQQVFIWICAADTPGISGYPGAELLLQPAGMPDLYKCVKSSNSLWTTFAGGKGGSAQYIEKFIPLCKPCSSSLHPLGSCPNCALITESWVVPGVRQREKAGGNQLGYSALHGRELLGVRKAGFYSWL